MKRCNTCAALSPANARFCMQCGQAMQEVEQPSFVQAGGRGWSTFALTMAGSVLISLILVFVFDLPIFFLAGFLPLFWFRRGK